jgi:hypothetical protein
MACAGAGAMGLNPSYAPGIIHTYVTIANTGNSTAPDHIMKPHKLGIFTPRSAAMAEIMNQK